MDSTPSCLRFGSTEQYGTHLPLASDTLVGEWLAEATASRLGKALIGSALRIVGSRRACPGRVGSPSNKFHARSKWGPVSLSFWTRNPKAGSNPPSATRNCSAPMSSEYPATIRIDKNEDRIACLSRRRSRVRVPSSPPYFFGGIGRDTKNSSPQFES